MRIEIINETLKELYEEYDACLRYFDTEIGSKQLNVIQRSAREDLDTEKTLVKDTEEDTDSNPEDIDAEDLCQKRHAIVAMGLAVDEDLSDILATNGRLNTLALEVLITLFRKAFWNLLCQYNNDISIGDVVTERLPLGSVFRSDRSYETPRGMIVPIVLREQVRTLKRYYTSYEHRWKIKDDDVSSEDFAKGPERVLLSQESERTVPKQRGEPF